MRNRSDRATISGRWRYCVKTVRL